MSLLRAEGKDGYCCRNWSYEFLCVTLWHLMHMLHFLSIHIYSYKDMPKVYCSNGQRIKGHIAWNAFTTLRVLLIVYKWCSITSLLEEPKSFILSTYTFKRLEVFFAGVRYEWVLNLGLVRNLFLVNCFSSDQFKNNKLCNVAVFFFLLSFLDMSLICLC